MVELVILSHSMDEMLVMAHGVIKAMVLHKEPIRLRTSPPSASHVRAFIVVRDGDPSGTQPPTPYRGRNLCHSHNDPHLGGWTPHQLQANLLDLGDADLWQLMEDLC